MRWVGLERRTSRSGAGPPAVYRWYPFIHLGEERKKKWSKVHCLRKQCDGWGLNVGPPDPELEVLTARPHMPPHIFAKAFHLI